jgi:hypothetical protein
VFDRTTIEFLEGGCALIVGTVLPDGEPHARRGWGLTVLSAETANGRLLLATEVTDPADLATGSAIAITAADVATLRSVQLKGRVLGTEAATDADRDRAGRFVDAFFNDIVETDGTPRAILDRLVPAEYSACLVQFDELYDQTPGPRAGGRLGRASG